MTPEAQRIAIAEACGWKFQAGTPPRYGGSNIPSGWVSPADGQLYHIYPDYLSDLNAMHEAEATLDHRQFELYTVHLLALTTQQPFNCLNHQTNLLLTPWMAWFVARASAPQRAKAFLRTLGLYV